MKFEKESAMLDRYMIDRYLNMEMIFFLQFSYE